MDSNSIKPSKVFYGVSGVTFLTGIILFVSVLFSGISSSAGKINNRVIVPGKEVIELEEVGKHTIYLEHRSVIDGKVFETNNINGLMGSLRNIETGESINITSASVNSSYSFDGREGKSIFDFVINETGKYELEAWYETGEGERAVLAIGKGFGMELIRTVISGVGILFISFGVSVTIFLVTLFKRKKSKNSFAT
ncbi:hypothetical protein CHISP_3094 [Chitinispirillum alkaliphilum]|nr:hypothetical protein CHISP_3094 [Chitinispirillum alkaliphilum]